MSRYKGKSSPELGYWVCNIAATPQANEILVRVMGLLRGIGDRKLAQVQLMRMLKYLTSVGNNWERADAQTAIAVAEPALNLQEVMMSKFTQELIERGVLIGCNQGILIDE